MAAFTPTDALALLAAEAAADGEQQDSAAAPAPAGK